MKASIARRIVSSFQHLNEWATLPTGHLLAKDGNGDLTGVPAATAIPPGMASMVSTKASGNVNLSISSTTGFVAIMWWDGSLTVAADSGFKTKPVPALTSPWGGSAPKPIYCWSCVSDTDSTQSGSLSTLYCNSNSLTSLNVGEATALTALDCNGNDLTALDVRALTSLATLDCSNNDLDSLNVSTLTSLGFLNCSGNNLTSFDVSALTSLSRLSCGQNSLTALDVSGLNALVALRCDGNNLASLRAVGVGGSLHVHPYSYTQAVIASNNNLDAAALDQFYSDLAPGDDDIDVSNNPGTTGDDPTIATAKGYTVIGT